MNINIKEIFKSDLDPNNTAWWSKDKIDKLNFNFYQFINGGMPGPQGTKGPDGDYGYMGPIGPQGFIGSKGFQGHAGASSTPEWIQWTPSDVNIPQYLFPKVIQSIGFVEQLPIVLKTGYLNPLTELPEDYLGAVKTVYSSPLVGATGQSQSMIGLRLQNEGKAADFRFKLTTEGSISFLDMQIGRIVTGDPGFDLLNVADDTLYEILGTNYIKITDSLITFGGNVSINVNINKAYSHSQFFFNQGALPGDILITEDTTGKVKWVNKKSIFGSFPIGSIISIRSDDFNSTNFHLNETVTQTGPPYSELQVIYGKGKLGGDYEGWYLCNGEKWKVANGVNEFQTPNLSSFNYTIQANGGGQNLISNSGDDSPIIIGGSDINLLATTDNSGNYQVDMSVDETDETIQMFPQVTTDYYDSRMVHIVFLDLTNLHWSNTVYAPPVPTTTTILLTSPSTYPKGACLLAPINQYTWTGVNTAEWSTFDHNTTTRYLYNYGTTNFAPAGYYGNSYGNPGGIARYWNGTQFTMVYNCPLTLSNTTNLITGPNVDGLNGVIFGSIGDEYTIDGLDFETSTSLEWGFVGAAPEGWYRETSTGIRRYWDGAGFIGATLYFDYVKVLPQIHYTVMASPSSCNAAGTLRTTFIDDDNPFLYLNLSDYEDYVLYVNYAWATGTSGSHPLMTATAMNAPGSTIKYRSAYRTIIYDEFQNITLARTVGSLNALTGIISAVAQCP